MLQNILYFESEVFHHYIAGSRSTETIETDYVALRSHVSIPALAHTGFDGQACSNGRRQDFIAILRRLLFEQFDTRHRDDAGWHAVFLKLLAGFEGE